jgi:tryptophan synthase alpha chain
MSNAIMCHLVAGYPDQRSCLALMRGLQNAGVTALEVQIPFSDPIADGETIMGANDVALEGGMTTAGSFALIETARRQGVDSDLYVMSYLQKVQHFGLEEFCRRAAGCQVKGLIIPDLPYDSPEFAKLREVAIQQQLEVVPVLSPGMPPARLRAALAFRPPTVYVTSMRGITGSAYVPDRQLKQLIADIKQLSSATIMIGFGIATPRDVQGALQLGDVAIVGSALINKLRASNVTETVKFVTSLVVGQA